MSPCFWRSGRLPAITARLFAAAILLTAHDRCSADDWPQWRGPSGQGITGEKNLPPRNSSALALRWKTPLPGEGCSSPSVSQGRVYLTAAYEGEKQHPRDAAAAWGVMVLAACVLGLTLLQFPSSFRAMMNVPPRATESRGRSCWSMGLGILTTFIIILTTIILARPQWFWQFSSPWTGTTVAAAEIPIIESLYLRPVIVFVAGSLVLVFVRLARQNPPLLARWMAVVTVCCTLSSAAAAGLMAWRPEWFWHSGQPCLAWIASGGVALFALASSAGWLAEGGILRLVLISLGLAMAGWLFCHTPSDQFTALLDLRIRLGYVVPPAMLLVAHGLLFALARQTGWPRPVRKNAFAGILPVILLPILALVLFVRSNYLRPETGLVRAVLCLDAQTGAMLWKTPVFVAAAEKTHAFNSHATPTPATDGDCVYAYFGSGLAALDRDGRILWLNHDPDYHRFSRYGTSSSVVLADDLLIIYQDSEYMGHGHHMDDQVQTQEGRRPSALIAVEKKTGAQRWRVTPEFSHDSYMTPLVWSHDGQREVVIATWKTLAGFAVRDGSLRWTHEYPMQQMVPSLAVHDDCLFVTGGNAFPCPIYAVRPPSGQKGEPGQTVWSARKEGGNMVSPVCWDGMLFCISHVGVLSCRFAETGKVHWRKRLGDRWFLGSLTAGDGKLFAVNHEGTLFVVAANSTGDVLAEYHFGENCAATPAIANGAILVRTANHLWCVSSTE